ncbi:phage tail protein [Streptomyces albiflavescens]|uniref:Phage tail protein n=1 Tax=Streptomyces albiflavescens TaxID=1623582 RepID=A0A917YFP1_9ACTN|nr:phage tail protein [Streptomyces albiflavescens]GGN94463.1 phage tail protein [Streptomyces albiflavescens]
MPRVDPYRNYNFFIEIDALIVGGFTECTGFGASVDPIEYREGSEAPTARKLPGMTKYTNITLKWGLTDSRVLFDWFMGFTRGVIDRKSGSIVQVDIDGVTEKTRWNFYEAWPAKWDGPDFNATSNAVAIETLELAVERMERA